MIDPHVALAAKQAAVFNFQRLLNVRPTELGLLMYFEKGVFLTLGVSGPLSSEELEAGPVAGLEELHEIRVAVSHIARGCLSEKSHDPGEYQRTIETALQRLASRVIA